MNSPEWAAMCAVQHEQPRMGIHVHASTQPGACAQRASMQPRHCAATCNNTPVCSSACRLEGDRSAQRRTSDAAV
eukprot:2490480-Alexandrium_andersonii.AAC.1